MSEQWDPTHTYCSIGIAEKAKAPLLLFLIFSELSYLQAEDLLYYLQYVHRSYELGYLHPSDDHPGHPAEWPPAQLSAYGRAV